jgi:DNA-binding NtrC family response regulator
MRARVAGNFASLREFRMNHVDVFRCEREELEVAILQPAATEGAHMDRVEMRPEDDLRLAAVLDVPVLVTADSRAQRDMCARLIHDTGSGRGPFVTFSAHDVRSAVEGWNALSHRHREHAILRRQFERARGGTLFIDDITVLRAPAQFELLSLLEERWSEDSSVHPDHARVRVVAGASRHLDNERATGAFFEPLFYRLNLIHINLIPDA